MSRCERCGERGCHEGFACLARREEILKTELGQLHAMIMMPEGDAWARDEATQHVMRVLLKKAIDEG